jgi:general secretion pathway protein A
MYRKHFGLTLHPFDKRIEPEELFASAAQRELEARFSHLLDLREIGVFTGESGSGKTTTCRKMVAGLHTGLHRVLYVSLTTGNVMDLYKTIAWEIGLPIERNRAALFRQIRNEVSRLCGEAKQKPVLIVDEAHHLRSDVLEDLRLLTNYAMDSDNRLCLVLIGHPELRRRLNMAVHEALSQRVVARARAWPGSRRGRPLSRTPAPPGWHRAAALRAQRSGGALPSLQRLTAEAQPARPPRPLGRRPRQSQVRHHRTPAGCHH